MNSKARIDWAMVIPEAADIADSYSTAVTLRQVFYRLVAAHLIPNTENAYNRLSRLSAEARRQGTFPGLADHTRAIAQPASWSSPQEILEVAARDYRRDRTEGQDYQVWVVLEKATLSSQVEAWLDPLGVPVVALRGYGSQTIIDDITLSSEKDGRLGVLLYVGDLDPTGEDITRDLLDRGPEWEEVDRLAVNPDQVTELDLIPAPGKTTDPRAAGFVERHGQLIQVEVEAIPPDVLQALVEDAVIEFIDDNVLSAVLEQEATERARLQAIRL